MTAKPVAPQSHLGPDEAEVMAEIARKKKAFDENRERLKEERLMRERGLKK